jgi:hypothetical protein
MFSPLERGAGIPDEWDRKNWERVKRKIRIWEEILNGDKRWGHNFSQ